MKFSVAQAEVQGHFYLRQEADLTNEEYEEVKEAMVGSIGRGPSHKRAKPTPKTQPPPPCPMVLALRDAVQAKNAALRKLKAACDKVDGTVASGNKLLPKITEKGYPAPMLAHYVKKIEPTKQQHQTHLDFWSEEAKKKEIRDPELVDEVKRSTEEFDQRAAVLHKMDAEFKKGILTDLRKITS